MTLGPDEQYVIGSGKDLPRDALHLRHARYWERRDTRWLADPNPFVLRKQRAGEYADETGWWRRALPMLSGREGRWRGNPG